MINKIDKLDHWSRPLILRIFVFDMPSQLSNELYNQILGVLPHIGVTYLNYIFHTILINLNALSDNFMIIS